MKSVNRQTSALFTGICVVFCFLLFFSVTLSVHVAVLFIFKLPFGLSGWWLPARTLWTMCEDVEILLGIQKGEMSVQRHLGFGCFVKVDCFSTVFSLFLLGRFIFSKNWICFPLVLRNMILPLPILGTLSQVQFQDYLTQMDRFCCCCWHLWQAARLIIALGSPIFLCMFETIICSSEHTP